MKRTSLVALSLLLASSLFADSGQRLIPAGSLISCTVGEPNFSSKTAAIGDPVLCQVGFSERYGRSVLPYNSFLEGRFEDYRDPGHFVGKGWMELKFDRMFIEPDTIIPIDARVVGVPGYRVDTHGRIIGKGHAVRDTVEWMIPILWPIDLLNLPRRGPRPTLKEETRLTLKVMDDLLVPATNGPKQDPYGLMHRSPNASAPEPPPPTQEQQPAPQSAYVPEDQPAAPPPAMAYAPMVVGMTPPVIAYAPVAYAPVMIAPPRPVIAYAPVMTYYAPSYYAPSYYAPRYYAPGAYAAQPPMPAAYYAPRSYGPSYYAPGNYAPRNYAPGAYAAQPTMPAAYYASRSYAARSYAARPYAPAVRAPRTQPAYGYTRRVVYSPGWQPRASAMTVPGGVSYGTY